MTLREQLRELGVDWATWKVWTEDGEVKPAERWLDYWYVRKVWDNISKGFHHTSSPGYRLVKVQEPGTIGRRWAILVMVPGLETYIS